MEKRWAAEAELHLFARQPAVIPQQPAQLQLRLRHGQCPATDSACQSAHCSHWYRCSQLVFVILVILFFHPYLLELSLPHKYPKWSDLMILFLHVVWGSNLFGGLSFGLWIFISSPNNKKMAVFFLLLATFSPTTFLTNDYCLDRNLPFFYYVWTLGKLFVMVVWSWKDNFWSCSIRVEENDHLYLFFCSFAMRDEEDCEL